MKLLIIGGAGGSNIGESLLSSARCARLSVVFINHQAVNSSFRSINALFRIFRNRKPPYIRKFSGEVAQMCFDLQPTVLLTTGVSPLLSHDLLVIKQAGVRCINYLTDDPWNSAHQSKWFLSALAQYDHVFSVRRANMYDIETLCGPEVTYLPFGYDPNLFYPEDLSRDEISKYESDIIFVGGADADRVPYIQTLVEAGLNIKLYGSYWDRYKATRKITQGQIDVSTIRKATCAAKIALCLVRRANRDDNCMRSFEIPAMRACMLAEDTIGHRAIFGEEGKAALYFKTPRDMLEKAHYLLMHEAERVRLARVAHMLIRNGKNTYHDRLQTMLSVLS